MTPKQQWKAWYRLQRICMRESMKAMNDMLVFGSCFIEISEDIIERDGKSSFIRYIPLGEIHETPSKE